MKKLSEIGKSLVKHAKSTPLPEITQTTALLPYLQVASETMSVREASAYLSKNHQISMSPSTISRALKAKDEHLGKIARYLELLAEKVARHYKFEAKSLFASEEEYRESINTTPIDHWYIQAQIDADSARNSHEFDAPEAELVSILSDMYDLWEGLPSSGKRDVRNLMFRGANDDC